MNKEQYEEHRVVLELLEQNKKYKEVIDKIKKLIGQNDLSEREYALYTDELEELENILEEVE